MKTVKFNKYKHKGKPWVTKGILTSLKTKERLYIKMIKSSGTDNYAKNYEKYKIYNSLYNKCIKSAKYHHWHMIFQQSKNDVKKTWENINTLLNKNNIVRPLPQIFYY